MNELDIKEQFKRFLLMKYGPRKEREFWKMMQTPESPLYRRCKELLNPSEREAAEDSDQFNACMRRVFDQLMESAFSDDALDAEDESDYIE